MCPWNISAARQSVLTAMPAFRVVILEAVGSFAVNNRHIEHATKRELPGSDARRNQFISAWGQ